MPWAADEPKPVEEKAELLRFFRGRFDLGEDFVYGVFARDESEVVGGTGLHTRIGRGRARDRLLDPCLAGAARATRARSQRR